jgi:hypothetical protein
MSKPEGVAELQGLYGTFPVPERVLQKLWLRGDFIREGLRTERGEALEIVDPGRLNRQEGPDFKGARLRVGGRELSGDVEVHFHQRDWWQHQHATAGRFDGVVLHVVLNPPGPGDRRARTSKGREPETFVLLPWLERDLESYATDEALLEMERLDELEWAADFLGRPLEAREARLREGGRRRWERKLEFARHRLEREGWAEACHQMTLEVLGYRRNREPMSRIALAWPLQRFRSDRPDAGLLFHSQEERWKLAGLRPSNHPLRRLRSYCELVRSSPCWPEQVRALLERFLAQGVASDGVAQARRTLGLGLLRRELADRVLFRPVGPGKLNTLACDALLPLAGAAGLKAAEAAWFHWYPGDAPDALRDFLRRTGLVEGAARPHCNGWNQGALAVFLGGGRDGGL